MDKSARKMLKYIRTNPICKDGSCLLFDFYDAYCKHANCSEQQAMACLRHLEALGYIQYCSDQYGHTVGFELEHRAHHAFYFAFNDSWRFVRNSILIPLVVAFLTSVITADLWPRLRPLVLDSLKWLLQWLP
ncbi:MAG: hypothetical protein IJ313_05880 [Clostridia bacterium]|nr:hypothetical protein [Clostridia bacterium]